jgi:PAS domain S-box-containing protein
MSGPQLPSDSTSFSADHARLKEPLETIQEAAGSLTVAREMLDPHDRETAESLDVVGRRLQAAEDELTTQLAEVESAARARQEERLLTRRLMAALPVPMLTTNAHGAIVDVNAAATELFGVSASFLTRKPVFAFIDPQTRRLARGLLNDVARARSMAEATLVIIPRDRDNLVPCQVTAMAVTGTTSGGDTSDLAAIAEVSWVIDPQQSVDRPGAYHYALLELCRLGIGEADLRSVLRRVAELAAEGIPGVDAVSVMLGRPGDPDVLASSSALAQAADGLQHLAGMGPIFDAHRHGRPVVTTDPFDDSRWPQLAHIDANDRSLQAWLALPLAVAGQTSGVMALYGQSAPRAGLDSLIDLAQPYVAATETLVRDSQLMADMARVRDELEEALRSRAVIDQAKGMIMITRGCDAGEAFSVLVQMSNTSNRKIRDLAQSFVEEASVKGPRLPG